MISYGNNINYALSQKLGYTLRDRGLTLALAESCTGGGLAEEITAVDGSSTWFDRCFVTYSNASKRECLGVRPTTLEMYGAVSQQTAEEMAAGVLKHSHGDFALSITGVAGPSGGSISKPVGLVWFGLAVRRTGVIETRSGYFASGRKNIRRCASQFALEWLLETLAVSAGL